MNKSKGTLRFLVAIIVIAAITAIAAVGVGKDSSGSIYDINLGLDLAGGVSITYQVVGDIPSQSDMDDTIFKLSQRAQVYSSEAEVYQEGANRINVDIPDVTDANAILAELGTPGTLYFIAQTDADGNTNYAYSSTSGYYLNYSIDKLTEKGSIVLTGNDVTNAAAVSYSDETSKATKYAVSLAFSDEGTKKFAEATKKALASSESIAIYYDGQFVSVPTVESAIETGTAQITNMSSYEAASQLATIIRIGAVPLQLEEVRSNVVGAKLGESAIETSLIAAAIGFAIIIIFMICIYRIMGLAASIALVLYAALDIVIMSLFNITLTLPGIAGVILSVGMAVDANVIIFARIREELAKGVSVRTAIKNGFDKALSAILDGNITTLIATAVLFVMGSGTIKGFASTLAIGIILSMFTALFVTKFILNALFAMGAKKPGLYGKAKDIKTVDFVGKKNIFFVISGALIVGAVAMLIVNASKGNMLNYNIDFIGGTATTIDLDQTVDLAYIDENVKPVFAEALGISTADIRANTVQDTNQIVLKTKTISQEDRDKVLSALEAKLNVTEKQVEMETISATVGNEMRRNALIAVAIATICMLIYICIRFKNVSFGLGSVLALIHDVFVVILFYAVLQWSVGTTFIACMLTIVGYSINATIVIFDRIRENMKIMAKNETLKDVANKSITQTISRSVNTSLTTLVTVVILAIMGVSAIKEFALPLIVGIVCGTYSSVCIAGNLWYVLFNLKKADK